MSQGTVKSVERRHDRVLVHVVNGKASDVIALVPNNYQIRRGDAIWWTDRHAYWTPAAVRASRPCDRPAIEDTEIKLWGTS